MSLQPAYHIFSADRGEICVDDPGEFEIHLKAARDIVNLRGSDGTEDSFVEQRLLWYVLSLTRVGKMRADAVPGLT